MEAPSYYGNGITTFNWTGHRIQNICVISCHSHDCFQCNSFSLTFRIKRIHLLCKVLCKISISQADEIEMIFWRRCSEKRVNVMGSGTTGRDNPSFKCILKSCGPNEAICIRSETISLSSLRHGVSTPGQILQCILCKAV